MFLSLKMFEILFFSYNNKILYFQIQFTCALILGINGIRTGCEFPLWMHYTLIIYMLSFIVLFGNFYVKAYMEKVKTHQTIFSLCLSHQLFLSSRESKFSLEWTWVVAKEIRTKKRSQVGQRCRTEKVLVYNKTGRKNVIEDDATVCFCIQQVKMPDVCQSPFASAFYLYNKILQKTIPNPLTKLRNVIVIKLISNNTYSQ